MRVVIWGVRDGDYVYQQIRKNNTNYEVVGFCDNYAGMNMVDELPIFTLEELVEEYALGNIQAVIIAVRKGYSRYCIIKQLQINNIYNISH